MTAVGAPIARRDGHAKVRGDVIYAYDYEEAGTIHGALKRSPVAAGRIVRLDVSKAAAMPGVRAVLTAADMPDTLAGWSVRDTPLSARRGSLHRRADCRRRRRHAEPGACGSGRGRVEDRGI